MPLGKLGQILKKLPRPPFSALAALCVIALWGCILIYSARSFGESPSFFVRRQFLWLGIGAVSCFAASMIPFRIYRRISGWVFWISIMSLICVLFFGSRVHGMAGWLIFSEDLKVQPSEFAKGALLLYLSVLASEKIQKAEGLRSVFQTFLPLAVPALICCTLVLLEPDCGTAFLLFLIFLAVYFIAGGAWQMLLGAILAALAAGGAFLLRYPYAWKRITDFISGGRDAWHIRQFEYALARGGLAGAGDGALWSNGYLPLPHTDSLFSTIIESSGLIGGLIVMSLLMLFAVLFAGMSRQSGLTRSASLYLGGIAVL